MRDTFLRANRVQSPFPSRARLFPAEVRGARFVEAYCARVAEEDVAGAQETTRVLQNEMHGEGFDGGSGLRMSRPTVHCCN